jgi:hypothetical protein
LKELQRKQEAKEAKEGGVDVDVESRPSSPVDGESTKKDADGDSEDVDVDVDVKSLRAEDVVKRPAHFKGAFSFSLPPSSFYSSLPFSFIVPYAERSPRFRAPL